MTTMGTETRASEARCNSTAGIQKERPHAPCGTPAAARRHHRRGEPLDPDCRDAFRRYHREYRQQARNVDAFRRREISARTRWERRVRTDPIRGEAHRAQRRAAARRRAQEARNAVDWVVVERLLTGAPGTTATRAERCAAYLELRSRGYSLSRAAERLHISGATARRFEATSVSSSNHTAAVREAAS